MKKFDDYQLQQFQIFEHEYGHKNTEIKKHPEWNGIFMNCFLHAEGKGEDVSYFYEVADWLSKYQLPSDRNSTQIGHDFTILSNLLKIAKMKHSLPEELPMDENGQIDEFMLSFLLIQNRLKLEGNPLLVSGRLSINDIGMFEDDYIYSEGIKKAYEIFKAFSSISQHDHDMKSADYGTKSIAENMWFRMNIKLMFDDMHIRGIQIVDALEYAGGSVQKLYECVTHPFPENTIDPNLVKYCNMKAAKRIRDRISNSEYIAVVGGASFDKHNMSKYSMCGYRNPELILCEYKMTESNYMEYLEEIEPLEIDWSKIDIIQDTSIEESLKAAEARGFKVIRKNQINDYYTILMYNQHTGAFINILKGQEDNVCYGGCDMNFWCKNDSIPWSELRHSSSGSIDDYEMMRWYEITYNEGLFSQYDNIVKYLNGNIIDWSRIGFGSQSSIPIPHYYDQPYIREDDLSHDIGYQNAHMMCHIGGYRLECIINTLIAHYDTEIDTEICPQYKMIANDDNGFKAVINHFCIWGFDSVREALMLCRLVKIYLQMPDKEYEKLISVLIEEIKEKDNRKTEMRNKRQFMDEHRSLSEYCYKNIHIAYKFPLDELIVEKAVSVGGRTLKSLGVKLPWI